MDRRIAISEFLRATCAPAIARPELSLTLPEIVPPATCARQTLPVTSAIAVTHATVKKLETNGARVGLRSIPTLLLRRIRLKSSPVSSKAALPTDAVSDTCEVSANLATHTFRAAIIDASQIYCSLERSPASQITVS